MNPNRVCRLCKDIGTVQKPMEELKKYLPQNPVLFNDEDFYGYDEKVIEQINLGITELRELTENCPICILSALKQSGIKVAVTEFNFQKELEEYWKEKNYDRYEIY
jgi:hypothetical protein